MININLGCGWRDFGKNWYHVDGGDYEHLDSSDIFNLPFDDNSVDLIYASHVIEYFDREEIADIINEWKSKLKPGGILRLAVPDFAKIAFLYKKGHDIKDFLGPLYGKMEMGNNTIYHKTTYDYSSLYNLLHQQCEFREVRRWNWKETIHSHFDDHSQAYLPHMDKENGSLISLNVEAVK
jgi:predicted SAM-dependent methyltransferase